jgi:hypothetical protein
MQQIELSRRGFYPRRDVIKWYGIWDGGSAVLEVGLFWWCIYIPEPLKVFVIWVNDPAKQAQPVLGQS